MTREITKEQSELVFKTISNQPTKVNFLGEFGPGLWDMYVGETVTLPRVPGPRENMFFEVHSDDPDKDLDGVSVYYVDADFKRVVEEAVYTPRSYEKTEMNPENLRLKARDLLLNERIFNRYEPIVDYQHPHADIREIQFPVTKRISEAWNVSPRGRKNSRSGVSVAHFVESSPKAKSTTPNFILVSESGFEHATEAPFRLGPTKKSIWVESFRSYFVGTDTVVFRPDEEGILVASESTLSDKFPSKLGYQEIMLL